MTAQESETFFPELDGDERRRADEWLTGYIDLIRRIQEQHERRAADHWRGDFLGGFRRRKVASRR